MIINDNNNFIYKVSRMSEEELNNIDLQAYLVSKASESDSLYLSKKELLDPELRKWLKKSVKNELNKIMVDDGEQKKFYILDYSYEITKPDYIAKLDIENDSILRNKMQKLAQSLNGDNSEFIDKETNFQIIKLSKDSDFAYFIFYRGVKTSAIEKKNVGRIPTIRAREQLVIQDKNVIEFGGKIELFIHDEFMYIVNPRTLEYAFSYDDHIRIKRDKNLSIITKMTFFDSNSNTEEFVKTSSKYILSRGLASIKEETLDAIEGSFDERCQELKEIKERIPSDELEKEEYLKKYESLWPLYKHIDVENHKVRFDPDHDVVPLLHFFSDKIVESFLTKKIKSTAY